MKVGFYFEKAYKFKDIFLIEGLNYAYSQITIVFKVNKLLHKDESEVGTRRWYDFKRNIAPSSPYQIYREYFI